MFRNVFTFELRFRLRQPSTYIYFGVLFAIAFLFISVQETFFGPSTGGKVFKNAPDTIATFMLGGSMLAMFITAAVMGTPIYRDDKDGIAPLFYTTPLGKWSYLGGRFAASMLVTWFIMSGMLFGCMAGSVMPWLDATKYGPFRLEAFVQPLVCFAFTNAFFAGCVFFAAYNFTRNALVIYLGGIVLFVLYNIANVLGSRVADEHLGGLIDPFGLDTHAVVTKYWTIAERNVLLVPFRGDFLWNRLLWCGLGLALLLLSFATFRMGAAASGKPPRLAPEAERSRSNAAIRRSPQTFGAGTSWWQWAQLTRVQFLNVVRAWPFRALALLGMVFVLFGAYYQWKNDGASYPVTYQVLSMVNNNFGLFFLIIITVYSGELVWRERELKLQQVYDALPLPNWVTFMSKLTALLLAQLVLYGMLVVTGVVIQAYKGFGNIEPRVYAEDFLLQALSLLQLCVLTMAVQTLVNNKYVGYTVMILFYIVVFIAPDALGLHHVLLKYDGAIPNTYSDMNGYGHFVAPLFWINLYYMAWALLMAVASNLLWVRGAETSVRHRGQLLAQRLVPAARLGLVGAGAAVLLTAGYVFYNTNRLNEYLTPRGIEARMAAWEKKYKYLARVPQPKIVATKLNVDLFPTAAPRHYRMQGTLTLRNRNARPLDTLIVTYDRSPAVVTLLTLNRASRVLLNDRANGLRLFRLAQPLAPGDSLEMGVDVAYTARGFTSRPQDAGVFSWASISPEDRLTANGTFLDGTGINLGYNPGSELEEDDVRQRNGLKEKERTPRLNDPKALMECSFTPDADYARFEATVSTDADQTAIAPGYLQKEWTQHGRRYFHYRMDAPMMNFYAILSARYQVHHERWQDAATGQQVSIDIYHDAKHPFNVARMSDALKKGLTYYTKAFGPYQYRQVRVLEFPRYKNFAQSFPNTIPTSEGAGFITDLRDKKKLDNVFFITDRKSVV